jgi:hypothetical protein
MLISLATVEISMEVTSKKKKKTGVVTHTHNASHSWENHGLRPAKVNKVSKAPSQPTRKA